jgi:hypothetical protein
MGTATRAPSLPSPTRPAVAERARAPLPWGVIAAAVGVAVWLAVDPRTPDLAGQVYRANLFREAGFLLWDSHWYAGHAMPAYSLLFPPLGAWLGVRGVGAAAVLAAAALFERIAVGAYGARAARWGAVWFAAAALGNAWSGQVTFALGVAVALGAVLALQRDRPRTAAALAGVCAACSPVAGALVALAGLTHSLLTRSPRSLLALGAPPAVVVGVTVALFGEGGWEPYPFYSLLATLAACAAFLGALPPGQPLLRLGAVVYVAACVACVGVHTPVGGNVERYGVLLAGPLLACALGADAARRRAARAPRPLWGGRLLVAAALTGIAVWTVWGPVRETVAVAGSPAASAAYYAPVARFVARMEAPPAQPVRVEVPLTRGHWEAAWLAPHVSLARGWEKQLDERYNGVLLSHTLSAATYRRWLDAQAVQYVALPDAPLDPSSAAEGRLIEAGLPYLREVVRTRHWRIYAVLGATPLASGPGTLTAVGHDWFALRARAAGRFTVRVRYTRYFTVAAGVACVRAGPAGWTEVDAARGGTVTVRASFSFGRALGLAGTSCRGAASTARSPRVLARRRQPEGASA